MKRIMFSDEFELTQAVLGRRKWHTRRIAGKPLHSDDVIVDFGIYGSEAHIVANDGESLITVKLPYKVGEIVAIAQSYKSIFHEDCKRYRNGDAIVNPAVENLTKTAGWNNKMFVRADLLIHHIRIANVWIERLQDISDEDCIKEGVEPYLLRPDDESSKRYFVRNLGHWRMMGCHPFETPREAYAALIDKISGSGTWESNPWVFAYEFELVK